MEYQNVEELMNKLSAHNNVEATKRVAEFYARTRFRIGNEEFKFCYTDGADDGDGYKNDRI